MPNQCGRSDQLPGVGDGVFLEVVAEGKIAQHLEERVMAVGEADVFEIVVLAARADAFLRSRGAGVVALFQAEEDVLELVHARVGEQQRGIVLRDERRRVHLAVSLLDEKVQKFAADFGAGQHFVCLDSSIGESGPPDGMFIRHRRERGFAVNFRRPYGTRFDGSKLPASELADYYQRSLRTEPVPASDVAFRKTSRRARLSQ